MGLPEPRFPPQGARRDLSWDGQERNASTGMCHMQVAHWTCKADSMAGVSMSCMCEATRGAETTDEDAIFITRQDVAEEA